MKCVMGPIEMADKTLRKYFPTYYPPFRSYSYFRTLFLVQFSLNSLSLNGTEGSFTLCKEA